MFDVIQTSDSSSSFMFNLIEFDIADLFISDRLSNSQSLFKILSLFRILFDLNNVATARAVEINYEESFDSNKRSFVKESRSVQSTIMSSFMSVSLFLNDDRRRRKEQKRMIKKIESQFVVEMFNEILEKYNTSILIRQMFKANKVNIS
jgi:hypothetical protein